MTQRTERLLKINTTKSWFFEKINKIDEPLARLTKEKRKQTHINKIRNEKGEVTIDIIQKYNGSCQNTTKDFVTNNLEEPS